MTNLKLELSDKYCTIPSGTMVLLEVGPDLRGDRLVLMRSLRVFNIRNEIDIFLLQPEYLDTTRCVEDIFADWLQDRGLAERITEFRDFHIGDGSSISLFGA